MNKLLITEPFSHFYVKGTVLWRACTFTFRGLAKLTDTDFRQTDKGTWICKVGQGKFIWEPEITDHKIDDRELRGITCFIDNIPDPDWTHLIVTGVSKTLKNPKNKNGCVFATSVKPYSLDDYLDFREQMFQVHRAKFKEKNFGKIVESVEQIWPSENRPGTIRCIHNRVFNDPKVSYDYQHITEEQL